MIKLNPKDIIKENKESICDELNDLIDQNPEFVSNAFRRKR